MNIFTLTLNPAFDVHCGAEHLALGRENIARVLQREAGGKGVNVSRALLSAGLGSLAVAVVGSENGRDYLERLEADGLRVRAIPVEGRIRENITVHVAGEDETRLCFPGFSVDGAALGEAERALAESLRPGDCVTLTGRVPEGIPMGEVMEFLARLRRRGARLALDSKSFSTEDVLAARPWLIKPNQEEISAYAGREIHGAEEALGPARELRDRGVENVMVSLGGEGALLACAEGCFFAAPPRIEAVSTIGAGDSAVAGFLAAAAAGLDAGAALREAVAFGSAACLTEGTRPPRAGDIAALRDRVRVLALEAR